MFATFRATNNLGEAFNAFESTDLTQKNQKLIHAHDLLNLRITLKYWLQRLFKQTQALDS